MQCCIKTKLSIVLVALVIHVLLSLRDHQGGETEITAETPLSPCSCSSFSMNLAITKTFTFHQRIRNGSNIEYNFHIVSSNVSPALLHLFFHDCFIEGCDASLLLDENGDRNRCIEKQAIPNQTLRGFDKIGSIEEEEVQQACPGNVSCVEILALGPRNFVLRVRGPLYPVLIGTRDTDESFIEEALATNENPRSDDMDNIASCTLHLFNLRRTNERETVSFVEIGCSFIQHKKKNICNDKLVSSLVMSKPKPKAKAKTKTKESEMIV